LLLVGSHDSIDRILFDAGFFRNVPSDSILIATVSNLADTRGEVAITAEAMLLRSSAAMNRTFSLRAVATEASPASGAAKGRETKGCLESVADIA
jgi:hypothetical protein